MFKNLVKYALSLSFLFSSMLKAQNLVSPDVDLARRESLQNIYLYTRNVIISNDTKWKSLNNLKENCDSEICNKNVSSFLLLAKKKETLNYLRFNYDPVLRLTSEDRKEILRNIEILEIEIKKFKTKTNFHFKFMSANTTDDYYRIFTNDFLSDTEEIPSVIIPIEIDSGSSDGNKPQIEKQEEV